MKLNNIGKIIAGIVIFIVLITFFFWYGTGKPSSLPAPSLDTLAIAQMKEKRCVEDKEFMSANHM